MRVRIVQQLKESSLTIVKDLPDERGILSVRERAGSLSSTEEEGNISIWREKFLERKSNYLHEKSLGLVEKKLIFNADFMFSFLIDVSFFYFKQTCFFNKFRR